MSGNGNDPLGILEDKTADPLGILETTPEKKSPEVTTSGRGGGGIGSSGLSRPQEQPSQTSGTGWTNASTPDTELKAPVLESTYQLPDPQAERKKETERLQKIAVAKSDAQLKDSKEVKSALNAVDFATQFPEYQQLQAIDKSIEAFGQPKTKEDLAAYNQLVAQRNELLDKPVTPRQAFERMAGVDLSEQKTPGSFASPMEYADYLNKWEQAYKENAKWNEQYSSANPKYKQAKTLRDILSIAEGEQIKGNELITKIKADREEGDAAIAAARELNKDKLDKLGFGAGFMEGMEQTTLANTVADMYFTGSDQLGKSLESIYQDAVVFPKDATIGGEIGQVLGGQVKPLAVGIGGSALDPALGFGAATLYYGRLGAGGGLIDAYTTARSQGMSAPEALEIAKQQAKAGAAGGLLEGAAGALTMGGAKPLASLAKMPFKTAVKLALKDNTIDSAVAGFNQVLQNKNMQRLGLDVETSSGVLENMGAEFLFGAGMNLAMYGGSKIKGYGTIVNGLAKLPFADIQAAVDVAVKEGTLDAAKAQQFTQDVVESKAAQDRLKGIEIPEKSEDAVIDLQKQIDKLENDKDGASPAVLPAIEAQIEVKSREVAEELGTPLNLKEQKEYEKLIEKRDSTDGEGKKKPLLDSEKTTIKHYENRIKTAEKIEAQKGKDEANETATGLGFKDATHLLNKVKKEGLGEFEKVQDVPQEILDKVKPTEKLESGKEYEAGDVVEMEPTVTEVKVEEAPKPEVVEEKVELQTPDEEVAETPTQEASETAEQQIAEQESGVEQQPNNGYETITEEIQMPDGEKGFKVSVKKPDGEVVELGNMYPEDVQAEVAKKVRGFKLSETKTEATQAEPTNEPSADLTNQQVVFEFAGANRQGVVQSVDEKGNYKVKSKDGKTYTVKPTDILTGDVATNKIYYENIAGSKPNVQTGRIPVEPIIGERKNIKQIIFDVSKGLKQKVFYSKTGRGAAGTYSPSNSAVKIKYNGDLDVTAHEIGHSIDDLFGILKSLKTTPNLPLEAELLKFSPFGSKPPHGHPNPKMYEYGEGMAEWIRAYLVNPKEAQAQAPNIFAEYEAKVPEYYKTELDKFSIDIRSFAGSSGRDMTLSNIEFEPQKADGVIKQILKPNKNGEFFSISWADKVAANFVDPLTAFNKAFEFAQNIKDSDTPPLPKDDPRILARLLLGVDGKYGEILEHGMIDGENKLLLDANGKAKNLEWLLEPLDNTDPSTIKSDMADVVTYMVSERTLELAKRFGRESRISGAGGGIFKDVDVAQKTLDEFNNGDPNRLARIKDGAARYREFADDILKYMVDKGRLSEDAYNEIKATNNQYVALNRVMETEPNREIESFSKSSGALGSKKEVINKVKGSSKEIVNPYISLIDGLHKSIKEADRNATLKAFRDSLVEQRGMYEGEPKKFAEIGVQGKEGDKNSIPVFVDGKAEHWVFQEDVYKALRGLDKEPYMLPKILTALPRMLRWSVTNFPTFAARNFIRDTQDRLIKSEDGSGIKDLFGNKEQWRELARSGGLNSGYYMRDKTAYYGMIEEAMLNIAKNKNNIIVEPSKLSGLWNSYTKMLQTSETSNRVAEYRAAFRKAKEQGMDDYNASIYGGYKSRDLMDFALMGHYMKIINQLVPFSNAAVQGLRKTYSSAKKDPVTFSGKMLAYTVLPQVALWALNHRDEETAKEYESLPAYQRDMAWNIKVAPNTWVVIPKPFEVGLPAASIDRGLSYMFYGNKDAFNGYGGSVAKGLMPLDKGDISGPIQGGVEIMANYDFFRDKHIVPPYEENLDLSLRKTNRASRLGQVAQKAIGMDARKIDHFIKSNTSYFGDVALKTSNIGREDGSAEKFNLSNLGFFKQTPAYNSPQVQEFIEFAEQWNLTRKQDFKHFKNIADKYFDAKTDEDKDRLAAEMVEYAEITMKKWEIDGVGKGEKESENDKKPSRPKRPSR